MLAPNFSKMDPKVKQEWVTALRSGEYKQCKAALRNGDSFCCLGVLCDKVDSSQWTPTDQYTRYASLMPPPYINEQVKLGYRETSLLSQLNDIGKSFEEIADWIEENL